MGILERDGWLKGVDHDIRIAEAPDLETAFLDREFVDLIDTVSLRYRSMTTSALVDNVYGSFPWFTLNSEAAHKRAASRPTAPPAVYTVGYEGIMVDALLDLLLRTGIRQLGMCDAIRSRAATVTIRQHCTGYVMTSGSNTSTFLRSAFPQLGGLPSAINRLTSACLSATQTKSSPSSALQSTP
jgi:hypothetical protein